MYSINGRKSTYMKIMLGGGNCAWGMKHCTVHYTIPGGFNHL